MRGSGAPVDFDIAAWARSAIQGCSRIDPVSYEALERRVPLFESVPGRFIRVNEEARPLEGQLHAKSRRINRVNVGGLGPGNGPRV